MGSRTSEVSPRCAVVLDRVRRVDAWRAASDVVFTLTVSGQNLHSFVRRSS